MFHVLSFNLETWIWAYHHLDCMAKNHLVFLDSFASCERMNNESYPAHLCLIGMVWWKKHVLISKFFCSHFSCVLNESDLSSLYRFGPVNLFWSTRYDKAMTLFLTCLKDFAEFARMKDLENNIPPDKCFKLPYRWNLSKCEAFYYFALSQLDLYSCGYSRHRIIAIHGRLLYISTNKQTWHNPMRVLL